MANKRFEKLKGKWQNLRLKLHVIYQSYSATCMILIFILVTAIFLLQAPVVKKNKKARAGEILHSGWQAINSGNSAMARQSAFEVLKIGSNVAEAHYLLGKAALRDSAWEQAANEFRAALWNDANLVDAYVGLANTAEIQGHIDQAIQYYRNVLEASPGLFAAQLGIANAFLDKGRVGASIEDIPMDDIIAAAPYFEQVLNNPDLHENINLDGYIRLLDNLARLRETPLRETLYSPTYIQKSTIAKELNRSYGDLPGAVELVEARFYFFEDSANLAETWLARAQQKASQSNTAISTMIDAMRHQYDQLKNWRGRTTTSSLEKRDVEQFRFNRFRTGRIEGTSIIMPRIKWRAKIGKVGQSSPIYYESRKKNGVFQVAPERGGIVRLDAATGDELGIIRKEDGFSSSTPAIISNNLLVDAPKGTMYAFPLDRLSNYTTMEQSRLKFDYLQRILDSSPLILGDRALFCTSIGRFINARIFGGKFSNWVWIEGDSEIRAPVVVGSRYAMFGGLGLYFYAVDYTNPNQQFQMPTPWRYFSNSPVTASATFGKGVVYFGDHAGVIHAVPEKTTPEKVELGYTLQKGIAKFSTKGPIFSSPAWDDSLVYFCSTDSTIYALEAFNLTGNVAISDLIRKGWRLSSSMKTNGAIYSSPCIIGGVLYVGTDAGEILALDAKNLNNILWRLIVDGPVRSSPFAKNGTLYVAADDGYLYAIGR